MCQRRIALGPHRKQQSVFRVWAQRRFALRQRACSTKNLHKSLSRVRHRASEDASEAGGACPTPMALR